MNKKEKLTTKEPHVRKWVMESFRKSLLKRFPTIGKFKLKF